MDIASTVKKLAWIDQVAGYVWVFLTLHMILAICFLAESEGRVWHRYSYHVLALIIVVWLYPLYTLGFRSLVLGSIGNVVVGLLAIYVAWVASKSSATAAYLIAPVVVWISAATLYVVLQLVRPTQ